MVGNCISDPIAKYYCKFKIVVGVELTFDYLTTEELCLDILSFDDRGCWWDVNSEAEDDDCKSSNDSNNSSC